MNLTTHPEYQKYLSDKDATLAVQALLIPWAATNAVAENKLKTAVVLLTALFQEYNQVMWHDFPFCQMCLGGCCVVGASNITPFDSAALTILGHDLPVLPVQTHHNEKACIYLGKRGCTFPAAWRPLKCMTFFSLGSGDWQLASSDERYDRLTAGLQAVLDTYLPAILGDVTEIDAAELADPIQFAASLTRQLTALFLPEEIGKDNGRSLPPILDAAAIALLFIATATAETLNHPTLGDEVLLADLEQFEWIVTGLPAHKKEMLEEINGRYLPTPVTIPMHTQFNQQIELYMLSINP